jgi:cation:H+ antiporter
LLLVQVFQNLLPVAIFQESPTVAVANAIGSNIANILLVLGLSAIAVKTLKAERNLIDIDLPLFFISTVLLILVLMDRTVTFTEGIILIIGYMVYIAYAYNSGNEKKDALVEAIDVKLRRPKIDIISILLLLGSVGVIYAAADLPFGRLSKSLQQLTFLVVQSQ